MKSIPKISIIVPAYNVEQYLPTCLSSIEQQTYQNFEVILIDDGSKDSTGEICDSIAAKDNRFKVLHQKNQGVSVARNVGIRLATGEYLCFVDSDDELGKNFLERFNFDYDISVQGYLLQLEENRTPISYKKVITDKNVAKIYCLSDIHSAPFSKLCKTDVIKRNNICFPEGISFSEDTIFFLQYIKYCKSIYVSDSYEYVYYKREGSLTTKHHDIEILMKKEKILFSIYNELFVDASFKKIFFHELSLTVLSKYYFYEGFDLNCIMSSSLRNLTKGYLCCFESILLKVSYPIFCYYALYRRRFKRRIIRPILGRYEKTLLNI